MMVEILYTCLIIINTSLDYNAGVFDICVGDSILKWYIVS